MQQYLYLLDILKTKLYQIFKEEDPEFTIEISKETKNYVIKLI